jgi:hypothetical protein
MPQLRTIFFRERAGRRAFAALSCDSSRNSSHLKPFVKMPRPPDRLRASEALVCEVTGVSQPLRQKWSTKHGLRRQPRGCYEEVDARELAALKAVLQTLGPADGSIAWQLIRTDLQRLWEGRPLVLLYDGQDKQATLATAMPALANAMPYGRPIIAIRLDDAIARAARAFRLATGGP